MQNAYHPQKITAACLIIQTPYAVLDVLFPNNFFCLY